MVATRNTAVVTEDWIYHNCMSDKTKNINEN